MYLGNGARFYVDTGGHPEFCTPECSDPWEVVRYTLAGERILGSLAQRMRRRRSFSDATFHKCNVDYSGSNSTWGCHESYLHRAEPDVLSRQLIPHFVSRIVYTGAGGFIAKSPGVEFTLSPRTFHLTNVITSDSVSRRGIYHTKDEPLGDRSYHRLHVICGEALCSQLAQVLKVGTTALIVRILEAGDRPADGLDLSRPLVAMRAIARDPSCRVTVALSRGGGVTAVEIQRRYLEAVASRLNKSYMPSWAAEICELWLEVLDCLEQDPRLMSTKLDWAIKRDLFRSHIHRRGMTEDATCKWTYVAKEILSGVVSEYGWTDSLVDLMDNPRFNLGGAVSDLLDGFAKRNGLRWEDLRGFLALREELFEIDTRFGELGDRGIFNALDSKDLLSHRLQRVSNVGEAMTKPPLRGRANKRGQMITRLQKRGAGGSRYGCGWESIIDRREGKVYDLFDPYGRDAAWRPAAEDEVVRGISASVTFHGERDAGGLRRMLARATRRL